MAKVTFKCNECGATYSREQFGACRNCGTFQDFSQVSSTDEKVGKHLGLKTSGAIIPDKKAVSLSEITSQSLERIKTGINELDRVLGGGFVEGEVVLLSGAPGAGKSTLSLMIAGKVADSLGTVLYSSGEESEQQIASRAKRANIHSNNIKVVSETNLEKLLGHIEAEKPKFLIVDSLQVLASGQVSGSVGSVQQSKEAAHTLTRLAKQERIITILISQVVKSGDFSGSETIQHIVDATMMFESDKDSPLKFLRTIKNRFGSTDEVGVFQHCETGLMEVPDPSGILMEDSAEYDNDEKTGFALSFMNEGVRQMPVEIQALAMPSNLPTPRKQFGNADWKRGNMICAVLDKFCKTKLYSSDLFVGTVAGVKVTDPMSDLAIAAAILSSERNLTTKDRVAFIGEITLVGHVRGNDMIDAKINEAKRLGFDRIVLPVSAKKSAKTVKGIKVDYIAKVKDLKDMF